MSGDKLGSKQTIILYNSLKKFENLIKKLNCLIKIERCDLVITSHRQLTGYIRSKRQTRKKTIITKQKQIIKKNNYRNEETQSLNQKQKQYRNFKF